MNRDRSGAEHTGTVFGLATWGKISLARLCVPKLYPTWAIRGVLAFVAPRKISNLRGFTRAREFESHPLRHFCKSLIFLPLEFMVSVLVAAAQSCKRKPAPFIAISNYLRSPCLCGS